MQGELRLRSYEKSPRAHWIFRDSNLGSIFYRFEIENHQINQLARALDSNGLAMRNHHQFSFVKSLLKRKASTYPQHKWRLKQLIPFDSHFRLSHFCSGTLSSLSEVLPLQTVISRDIWREKRGSKTHDFHMSSKNLFTPPWIHRSLEGSSVVFYDRSILLCLFMNSVESLPFLES